MNKNTKTFKQSTEKSQKIIKNEKLNYSTYNSSFHYKFQNNKIILKHKNINYISILTSTKLTLI